MVAGNLPAGRQNPDGNRQIEPPGLFRQIGRRQIDRDFLHGEFKAALQNGGAHTVAAFFHFGIGQADQVALRQPVGQVHFHLHQRGVHAA